jgi:hypothetical protein
MASLDGVAEPAYKGRLGAGGVRGVRHAERHVAGLADSPLVFIASFRRGGAFLLFCE